MATKKKLAVTLNPLEDTFSAQQAPLAVELVSLNDIRVDKAQPRKLNFADADTFGEASDAVFFQKIPYDNDDVKLSEQQAAIVALARDIIVRGVHTPISVTPVVLNGEDRVTYKIVAGERRVRAASLANFWVQQSAGGKGTDISQLVRKDNYDYTRIMAVVLDEYSDATERFEVQLSENILRQDMTDEETALAFQHLLDTGRYKGVRDLAKRFGKDHTSVYNMLAASREPNTALELREIGVTNAQYIGKLCAAVSRSREAGESACELYDAFVKKWKEVESDGKTPGAKSVWDEVTKDVSAETAPVVPAPVVPAPVVPAPVVPAPVEEPMDDDEDDDDTAFGGDMAFGGEEIHTSSYVGHTGNDGITEDDMTFGEVKTAQSQIASDAVVTEDGAMFDDDVEEDGALIDDDEQNRLAAVRTVNVEKELPNVQPETKPAPILVPTVELSDKQARSLLTLLNHDATTTAVITGAMIAKALVNFKPD